jgi:hypothetical protein
MQDLNKMEVTQEEDQAMEALTEKQKEQLETHEQMHQMHQVIQSVMGQQYTPMDTSPEAQSINQLVQQLTQTFNQLINTLAHQYKAQQPSEKLNDTVDTVLGNAEWFKEMVGDQVEALIDGMDHSYGIESAVEDHFNNSFCLEDHVDVSSEVENVVENVVENQIDDVVERVLQEKLRNITITFN